MGYVTHEELRKFGEAMLDCYQQQPSGLVLIGACIKAGLATLAEPSAHTFVCAKHASILDTRCVMACVCECGKAWIDCASDRGAAKRAGETHEFVCGEYADFEAHHTIDDQCEKDDHVCRCEEAFSAEVHAIHNTEAKAPTPVERAAGHAGEPLDEQLARARDDGWRLRESVLRLVPFEDFIERLLTDIEKAMTEQSMSRADLARRMACSRANITQLFDRTTPCTVEKMVEVAACVGLVVQCRTQRANPAPVSSAVATGAQEGPEIETKPLIVSEVIERLQEVPAASGVFVLDAVSYRPVVGVGYDDGGEVILMHEQGDTERDALASRLRGLYREYDTLAAERDSLQSRLSALSAPVELEVVGYGHVVDGKLIDGTSVRNRHHCDEPLVLASTATTLLNQQKAEIERLRGELSDRETISKATHNEICARVAREHEAEKVAAKAEGIEAAAVYLESPEATRDATHWQGWTASFKGAAEALREWLAKGKS